MCGREKRGGKKIDMPIFGKREKKGHRMGNTPPPFVWGRRGSGGEALQE